MAIYLKAASDVCSSTLLSENSRRTAVVENMLP